MFVLKGILRAESQEKILLYLLQHERGYGSGIADFYSVPKNPIQKQLVRMEQEGVLVSYLMGKARVYELNDQYCFYEPLRALLQQAILVMHKTHEAAVQQDPLNQVLPQVPPAHEAAVEEPEMEEPEAVEAEPSSDKPKRKFLSGTLAALILDK